MKKTINLQGIREGLAELKRIAAEHPELIDHSQSNWTEEDIVTMVEDKAKVFTIQEAAEILKCHKITLSRAIKAGKLRAGRSGNRYIISRSDLEDYYTRQGGGELFEQ